MCYLMRLLFTHKNLLHHSTQYSLFYRMQSLEVDCACEFVVHIVKTDKLCSHSLSIVTSSDVNKPGSLVEHHILQGISVANEVQVTRNMAKNGVYVIIMSQNQSCDQI